MPFIEKLKDSLVYSVTIIIISTIAITWGFVQNIIILPIKDDIARQSERIKQLEAILSKVKTEYDIPDSIISDLLNSEKLQEQDNFVDTLKIIDKKSFEKVNTVIKRNQTTQIRYFNFSITVSIASVDHDGQTIFNVGYTLPTSEIPQSLQIELYPAQTMTIKSSPETGDIMLFYVHLIASDPLKKISVVEVSPLKSLKDIINLDTKGG